MRKFFWGFGRKEIWVGGNSLGVGEEEREVQAVLYI